MQKNIKIIFGLIITSLSISLLSCSRVKIEVVQSSKSDTTLSPVWYMQTSVDLGKKIIIKSVNEGIAVSSGRGDDIKGKLYHLSNGIWQPIHEFPYSDYPLISYYKNRKLWLINHLSHQGFYKPKFTEFDGEGNREISLPNIMWDKTDHVMWEGISSLKDGTAWMVGQQGYILHYDGIQWKKVNTDFKLHNSSNYLAGDLTDIQMLNKNYGWAVGKEGAIRKYDGKKWSKFSSPVKSKLNHIYMLNKNTGWIVGDDGVLLEFNGIQWKSIKTNLTVRLNSVKALDKNHIWVVGDGSTLLFYNMGSWKLDSQLKNYNDEFNDIDYAIDSLGSLHLWVIGNAGIYTTSQTLNVSFSNYTQEASIRSNIRSGTFITNNSKALPDLLAIYESAPPILYHNDKGIKFTESTLDKNMDASLNGPVTFAVGDINNDGYQDLIFISDEKNSRVYLGTSGDGFIDFTKRSNINFSKFGLSSLLSARLLDFDNDGNLDLYITNYSGDDWLYKNNGAGEFENIYNKTGITKWKGYTNLGACFNDFNNDGLVDIFFPYNTSKKNQLFQLFINQGKFKFHEKIDPSFFNPSNNSIQTSVAVSADFNNDGKPDILIHNQKDTPWLLLNKGNASFRKLTKEVGFTKILYHPEPLNGNMNTADVNNDGRIDVFISSHLFLNEPGLKFTEVTDKVGINFVGDPVFADFDNDGDEDLFIGSSESSLGKGERSALFRNNLNNQNFIKVRCTGDLSNTDAFGTKILLETYNNKNELICSTLRTLGLDGSPMCAQNLNEVHFGICKSYKYVLKVKFPSGKSNTITNIKPGSIIKIHESSYLTGALISLKKSIIRTLLLINLKKELINFMIVILILGIVLYTGIKLGVGGFVKKWYFSLSFILFYFVLIHLTVLDTAMLHTVLPIGFISVAAFVSVASANIYTKRKEAQIISHYKIKKLIGEGGMGKVYEAVDINTKRVVALKILNPQLLKDPENRRRFSVEGQILSGFDHKNIVKVFDVGENSGRAFIAMEYLIGGTLKEFIDNNYPCEIELIKKIALQICNSLKEIHSKNIIHRDIKTNNIMLDENGDIRIMDFGLSKSPLVSTMTSLGTVLGTLGYVAPEQITNVAIDTRTDIFSLGVVLFEMATNDLPFKGENEIALIHSIFNTNPPNPSAENVKITTEFDLIVEKCLKKDIGERYKDINLVIKDIENLI